jgi:excisionase family DNA binding protein
MPEKIPVQFYTMNETGRLLTLSRTTIYNKIKSGEIPTAKIGRRVLIPAAYINRLVALAMQGISSRPPEGAA